MTGRLYLGGYIRDVGSQATFLGYKVKGWEVVVKTLAGVACQHPQVA